MPQIGNTNLARVRAPVVLATGTSGLLGALSTDPAKRRRCHHFVVEVSAPPRHETRVDDPGDTFSKRMRGARARASDAVIVSSPAFAAQ